MELSKREKAVIEAMRRGADVQLSVHRCEDLDEVDKYLKVFEDVCRERRIAQLGYSLDGERLVLFKAEESLWGSDGGTRTEVNLFMNV